MKLQKILFVLVFLGESDWISCFTRNEKRNKNPPPPTEKHTLALALPVISVTGVLKELRAAPEYPWIWSRDSAETETELQRRISNYSDTEIIFQLMIKGFQQVGTDTVMRNRWASEFGLPDKEHPEPIYSLTITGSSLK